MEGTRESKRATGTTADTATIQRLVALLQLSQVVLIQTLVTCKAIGVDDAVVRSLGYQVLAETFEAITISVVQGCLRPASRSQSERDNKVLKFSHGKQIAHDPMQCQRRGLFLVSEV